MIFAIIEQPYTIGLIVVRYVHILHNTMQKNAWAKSIINKRLVKFTVAAHRCHFRW